jgi:hypothetical protein
MFAMTVLLIFAAAGLPFLGLWLAGAVRKSHPMASRIIIGAMQLTAAGVLVGSMMVKCSGPMDVNPLPADW